MKVKNGPPLFSEGDEGEWARVKMVRGKLPISSPSGKIFGQSSMVGALKTKNESKAWTPAFQRG
jgi:hypothetical protein